VWRLRFRCSDQGKAIVGLAPIVFGPCTLRRTWGTRPIPSDFVQGTESLRSLALLQEVLYLSCRSERGNMTGTRIDLPQGTLDLLILRTLALGPQHGWAISERVQQMSSDVLRIQQGSLYPALHRMERRGLIKARWGTSENNRRAKYYELSKNGRQQLEVQKDAWQKLTAAVAQVLGTA
jgi:PadR family transcriptional regulator PadR